MNTDVNILSSEEIIQIDVIENAVVVNVVISEETTPEPVIIEGFEYPAGTEYIQLNCNQARLSYQSIKDNLAIEVGAIDGYVGTAFHIIHNNIRYETVDDTLFSTFLTPKDVNDLEDIDTIYIVNNSRWSNMKYFSTLKSNSRSIVVSHNLNSILPKLTKLENFIPWSVLNLNWDIALCDLPVKVFSVNGGNGSNTLRKLSSTLESFTTNGFFTPNYVIDDEKFGHLVNLHTFRSYFSGGKGFYKSGADKWTSIQSVDIRNSGLPSPSVDALIIDLDASGVSNGSLIYTVNSDPTSASYTAYNNLISKGWTIIGTPPPAP